MRSFIKIEQSLQNQSLDETTMSFLQHLENDQSRLSTTSKKDLDTSVLSRKSEQIKIEPKIEKSFDKPQKNVQTTPAPQSQSNISRTTSLNTTVVNTSVVNQSVVNTGPINPSSATPYLPSITPQSNNPLRVEIQNKHHPASKDQTLMGIDLVII